MKDIAVVFGGVSQEHDISIITGVLTLNSIDKTKYNAIPCYIHSNGIMYSNCQMKDINYFKSFNEKTCERVILCIGDNTLYRQKKNKIKALNSLSAAVNCLHGRNGEDGSLFGLFQLCNVPVVGSGLFASALSIDKAITKSILSAFKIKVVEGEVVLRNNFYTDREKCMLEVVNKYKLPLIIKPALSGSSIGVNIANDFIELEKALENAFMFDEKAVVEKYLTNAFDVNLAAYKLNGEIVLSPPEKPITVSELLSFSDKYSGSKNGHKREFPAKISKKHLNEILQLTKNVYQQFDFSGIIRIDYLIYENTVYLNEINSIPGSLSYYLLTNTLADFTNLLSELINQSIQNYLAYKSSLFEYSSNVLKGEFITGKK